MRTLSCLIGFVAVLHAQSSASPRSERPSVRVHGEATISVTPDQAEMDVGVVSQGTSTDAVSAQNTERTEAVVRALRALIPAANITTVNLSVNPNYRYPKEGAPAILGYTASNTVRLQIEDLNLLRKAIEIALRAGATSINRLNFTLRSEAAARARALGEAANEAEAGAQALADSLRLTLGHVIFVEEGQPVVISPAPQVDLGRAQSSDMSPVSPGQIQLHANVNITYELLDRKSR